GCGEHRLLPRVVRERARGGDGGGEGAGAQSGRFTAGDDPAATGPVRGGRRRDQVDGGPRGAAARRLRIRSAGAGARYHGVTPRAVPDGRVRDGGADG